LLGAGPDLSRGHTEKAPAQQAEVAVGDGEDAARPGAKRADYEFAIAGVRPAGPWESRDGKDETGAVSSRFRKCWRSRSTTEARCADVSR
jgi:hypothetical protein